MVRSGPFPLQIPCVCRKDASFNPVSQRAAKGRFLKEMSGGGKIRLSIRYIDIKSVIFKNRAKYHSYTIHNFGGFCITLSQEHLLKMKPS